jgi:hypothetical protein
MNLKEEINRASPMVDRVNDAIRDNPLAAGLIGAGLAWMIFGTRGFATLGGLEAFGFVVHDRKKARRSAPGWMPRGCPSGGGATKGAVSRRGA